MTTLKWTDLNPVGRAIIVVVAALTAAVAAVAFATSYGALYAWIRDTGLYSERLTRAWPLLLDAAFVIAQLAAILGGILRGSRGWPILTMLITGALTVWFNLQHAGADPGRRLAAALPPVLMMLCFEIDISIVRWVMRALGKPMDAVTPLPPGFVPAASQLPSPGVVPGALYRPHGAPSGAAVPGEWGSGPGLHRPPAPDGQLPSWAPSQTPQNGQPAESGTRVNPSGDPAEVTKRHQVETYLAELSPDQLDRLHALGPRAAARELTATLTGQGLPVSVRYVQQLWDRRPPPAATPAPRARASTDPVGECDPCPRPRRDVAGCASCATATWSPARSTWAGPTMAPACALPTCRSSPPAGRGPRRARGGAPARRRLHPDRRAGVAGQVADPHPRHPPAPVLGPPRPTDRLTVHDLGPAYVTAGGASRQRGSDLPINNRRSSP